MKALSLAVRFGCELAALVAVGWWGWTVTPLLGIVLPIVVALVWGAWITPRARRRLPDPGRLALELVIFAVATALPYRKVSDTFKVSDTSSQF